VCSSDLQRYRRTGVPLRVRTFAATHGLLAAGARAPRLAAVGTRVAGRVLGRRLPTPRRAWSPPRPPDGRPDVALMMDTFTRYLHPEVGIAAVAVFAAVGLRVAVVDPGCCGRAQYSQGRLVAARRQLRGALGRLAPYAIEGVPVVTLEPSCWSMLTDDAAYLLDDPRIETVGAAIETFEQSLLRIGVPELRPRTGTAVVHRHCHDRALAGPDALTRLVGAIPGLDVVGSGAGCCGMAGAFGYAQPELSRAIAEDRLVPAARAGDFVVAHGSSCRQQVTEVARRPAVHPAVLIAAQLP
jgi:Fe-S oxidoreductase